MWHLENGHRPLQQLNQKSWTRSKVDISDFWDGFSSSPLPLHHNFLQQCAAGIEDNIWQIMVISSEIFAADADDNLDDTNNNEHQLAEDRDKVLRGLQRDHYQQQRWSSSTPPWKVSTWYHLKPILIILCQTSSLVWQSSLGSLISLLVKLWKVMIALEQTPSQAWKLHDSTSIKNHRVNHRGIKCRATSLAKMGTGGYHYFDYFDQSDHKDSDHKDFDQSDHKGWAPTHWLGPSGKTWCHFGSQPRISKFCICMLPPAPR